MQNKPNFPKAQMNLSYYVTKDYADKGILPAVPKQSQNKPNLSRRSVMRSRNKPNFTILPTPNSAPMVPFFGGLAPQQFQLIGGQMGFGFVGWRKSRNKLKGVCE
jgi:hypothetical protein